MKLKEIEGNCKNNYTEFKVTYRCITVKTMQKTHKAMY